MRGVQKTVNQHSGVQAKAAIPQVEEAPVVKVEEAVVAAPKPVKVESEFVTLTASDPRMKLEASVNGNIWVGNSITFPRVYEEDIRRMLSAAGMYVKN